MCVWERDLLERNKKVFNMQFLWLHLFKEMNESWLSLLFTVTNSKEKEASRTEEEKLQDAQRPFGWITGGLLRWHAYKEVKYIHSVPYVTQKCMEMVILDSL